MGLRSWWNDINKGGDAAEILIEQDLSYVSDDTLIQLGQSVGADNPHLFAKSARDDLNRYHETNEIKDHGSAWQKFDRGVLIDEEQHPILKKFLPF